MATRSRTNNLLLALASTIGFGVLANVGDVGAQQLTHKQMITSLGRLDAAAPEVDIALLMEQANANVGNGVTQLPDWSRLAKLSQLVVEINFENNSIAIEPDSYRALGLIADALHHPDLFRYKFLVVGHTSSTGNPKHNLELSQQRADAIREVLATTFAVSPDRLYSIGVGQEWPIDSANPANAVNRRVQLINLGLVK
ncbi:OmpA family protein [Rhizobium sp. TH2]|uniref:OmpA family protein n=1 Tax=Rhizobium sp. TH2 TaxID=2775403 RepID=UPI0021587C8F|nr:OmpA family protein [Rhizobium sp. TH2]UVC09603.1 OmpA family protein [Rhizobium sp. TH2]